MTRTDPEFEAWVERARHVSIERAAEIVRFVPAKGQGKRREQSGPCPLCGGTDRFSVNTAKKVWNCRGCGKGGRDGISMVRHVMACDFLEACEIVEGPRPSPPLGETEADRDERRRRWAARLAEIEAERGAADAAREREDNAWREAERRKAYGWWQQGRPWHGTDLAAYLRARSLVVPLGCRLRFHPSWTLYDGDEPDPRSPDPDTRRPHVVHRGPAMFLPIVEGEGAAERFLGLHITWIDPARPGEKILVVDDAGERVPAKKIRGGKSGGHIVAVAPGRPAAVGLPAGDGALRRLFLGEGFETVLSVFTALAAKRSRLLEDAGFRTSVDLGNLGGRAADRIFHPTETKTDSAGRVRRVKVPGIVPDIDSRAVVVPESVEDLHLVGDGDSEAFRTRCVLVRAAARHARPGRAVRLVMAPEGRDFNDMIRAGGA